MFSLLASTAEVDGDPDELEVREVDPRDRKVADDVFTEDDDDDVVHELEDSDEVDGDSSP